MRHDPVAGRDHFAADFGAAGFAVPPPKMLISGFKSERDAAQQQ